MRQKKNEIWVMRFPYGSADIYSLYLTWCHPFKLSQDDDPARGLWTIAELPSPNKILDNQSAQPQDRWTGWRGNGGGERRWYKESQQVKQSECKTDTLGQKVLRQRKSDDVMLSRCLISHRLHDKLLFKCRVLFTQTEWLQWRQRSQSEEYFTCWHIHSEL